MNNSKAHLLAFSLMLTISIVKAQFRSEAQIRTGPKSIAEYYLIGSGFYGESGDSYMSRLRLLTQPQTEEFKRTIDAANGYIEITDSRDQPAFICSALFIAADGSHIIAYLSRFSGACDDESIRFYKWVAGQGLIEIPLKNLLPSVSMADFLPTGIQTEPEITERFLYRYTLPRIGTSIRVMFTEPCEVDNNFYQVHKDAFTSLSAAAKYKELLLEWQPKNATFKLGNKIAK